MSSEDELMFRFDTMAPGLQIFTVDRHHGSVHAWVNNMGKGRV